jgi:Zn-dependent protease
MINNMDRLEKKKVAVISLAGPIISLMAAMAFLAIMAFGGSWAFIGINGLPVCMVAAVYSLLPIDPMEGKKVWNWNKMIWMAVFIPAIIGYIAMLVYYSMNLM